MPLSDEVDVSLHLGGVRCVEGMVKNEQVAPKTILQQVTKKICNLKAQKGSIAERGTCTRWQNALVQVADTGRLLALGLEIRLRRD